MDGRTEAYLIALTCGAPPAGRSRWTLRLLGDRMVGLGYVESLSHETVRRTLKKTRLMASSWWLVISGPPPGG